MYSRRERGPADRIPVAISILFVLASLPVIAEAQVNLYSEGEPNDSNENAKLLKSGDYVQGSIEEGDRDWFTFSASRGDTVKLGVGISFSYRLIILDSSLNPVERIHNSFDYHYFTPTSSGRHYVVLRYHESKQGRDNTGEYTLLFDIRDSVGASDGYERNDEMNDATPVPVQGSVSGVLAQGDEDWYTLRIARDSLIRVHVFNEDSLSILLYDNDGKRIDAKHAGDVFSARAPYSGQYFISIVNKKSPDTSTSVEYDLLFDFEFERATVQTPTDTNTPVDPDSDLPMIIAAVIGALATIIAAIISRK